MDIKYIGENLKAIRLQFGLSQSEMSEKIGINQANYSHIERGTRGISIKNIIKVCKIFNTTFEYLVTDPYVNLTKESTMIDKEKMNQLTNYELIHFIEAHCKVIYELSIILATKINSKNSM